MTETVFYQLFSWLNYLIDWLGGGPLVSAILGVGIYLTVKSGFLPVRRLPSIIRSLWGGVGLFGPRPKREGDIPPFQALTTALAATVGTGNIAGVATALVLGGPGAIFWMWVSAFFGMMTKYSEIVLAIRYRRRDRMGLISGGPMYVLDSGLNFRFWAYLFAVFGSLAAFGIGNMVQANSVADALHTTFGVSPLATGLILAFITAMVIIGGIKRIGFITVRLVPLMSFIYVSGAVIILVTYRHLIPESLGTIIAGSFSGTAAAGGFAGAGVAQALRYGVSRGVFTNEAGLGSASIAHAAAQTDHPAKQGTWGIMEVFIDTHLICTMTALVLMVTGAWTSGLEGASMTVEAFNRGIPFDGGGFIVSIGLVFFAFSTLISWSYYGEKCFQYIYAKGQVYYRLAWVFLIVVGAMGGLRFIWALADTLNMLMAVPNLIGLIGLSGIVLRLSKDL